MEGFKISSLVSFQRQLKQKSTLKSKLLAHGGILETLEHYKATPADCFLKMVQGLRGESCLNSFGKHHKKMGSNYQK